MRRLSACPAGPLSPFPPHQGVKAMPTTIDNTTTHAEPRPNIFVSPDASRDRSEENCVGEAAVFASGMATVVEPLPTIAARRSQWAVSGSAGSGFSMAPVALVTLVVATFVTAAMALLPVLGHRAHPARAVEHVGGASVSARRARTAAHRPRVSWTRKRNRFHRPRPHSRQSAGEGQHTALRAQRPPQTVVIPAPSSALPVPSASRALAHPAPVPAGALPEFP
jgi:hypothetical protein